MNMKYPSLDLIPVIDAFQVDCECPLCYLYTSCDERYIDNMLSSAYMEPDWRMITNKVGFCSQHFRQMYSKHNRLGVALMTDTHLQDIICDIDSIFKESRSRSRTKFVWSVQRAAGSAAQKISARLEGCAICSQIKKTMERYVYTTVYLYKTNDEFRTVLANSKGFCLPHLSEVVHIAPRVLSPKDTAVFFERLHKLELDNLWRVEKDLKWFTLKYDYRNKDLPWENSRDAVERSINKISGRCITSKDSSK